VARASSLDVALEAPDKYDDKYFVIKPKSGDTIRTPSRRPFQTTPINGLAGFLRVPNSEHVAHKLANAGIEFGDWKNPEAMQVEQSNCQQICHELMTALFDGTVEINCMFV
jgi:hypothetical protein